MIIRFLKNRFKKRTVEEVKKSVKGKVTFKELIAPKTIDPNNNSFLAIINSKEVLCRTFYVSDFPRRATFAYTFEPLYKFKNTIVSTFVEPKRDGKVVNDLNDVIDELDTERLMALGKNRNRARTLSRKMAEAEELRDDVDSGENEMFDISFLVTVYAEKEDELDKLTEDLIKECQPRGVELTSCYGEQDKAFKSNAPINKNKIKKKHPFDMFSASALFHYTQGDFQHKKGMPFGRHIYTGTQATFDPFDPSLNGHNILIAGMTRSGKSAFVKKLILLFQPLGFKFVTIDAEGEYGSTCDKVGGTNIIISPTTKTIINPFEVGIAVEKDDFGIEIPVLNLIEKISDVTWVLATMARGTSGANNKEFSEMTLGIIEQTVREEYEDKRIYHGDVDSLFQTDSAAGRLGAGKKKKDLPTIGSWYERILVKAEKETNPNYKFHYDYLVMVMRKYVRQYGGSMAYFDGQSTVDITDTCPHTNIDIHLLNENFERPLAMQILNTKVWEQWIKRNSEDPLKAEKKWYVQDEMWMQLPFPEARKQLETIFRRAGKRHVIGCVSTQRLKDFNQYDEMKAIITQAATKFVGKCDEAEIDEVKELIAINDNIARYLLSVKKGQFFMRSGPNEGYVQVDLLDIERLALETDISKIKEIYEQIEVTKKEKEMALEKEVS